MVRRWIESNRIESKIFSVFSFSRSKRKNVFRTELVPIVSKILRSCRLTSSLSSSVLTNSSKLKIRTEFLFASTRRSEKKKRAVLLWRFEPFGPSRNLSIGWNLFRLPLKFCRFSLNISESSIPWRNWTWSPSLISVPVRKLIVFLLIYREQTKFSRSRRHGKLGVGKSEKNRFFFLF